MDLNHTDQPAPLSIRIVDVAPLHDHIAQPATPSRLSKVIQASKANIVRLIPGTTRFPVGPEFDTAASAAS